ncbi:hypothetical protein J4E85_008002 [Alternaria conjuncta]|uniref:uncharacterized protein n=1 Tax=Alternaria conjuncta TaxID=181017 RepID=UPI002220C317|nr:uncharacterized protein J4E85_008002 [Alternaria conjuncta]KAI4923846.1 hypothetical protein J4E85_008002 [Alternaria conjuncta]
MDVENGTPTAPAPLGVAQATALTPSGPYPTPENADRGNKKHEAEVKRGIDIKYPVAMQAYDPHDMFFAKSSIKSWTKEESAKEYDRLTGAYMALRHEHISILVDQDSKEKNARRQVTQYTGKAPGSFTPQEAQHILNLHKDDCIKDLKGATLAATGANLEEFGIDETIVTQAYDLPGDRSWFEKISDHWRDAARDVISAPKDEKKKGKLGPEVAETELKRMIERADTYWVLDVTTEDIQRTLSFATGRSHFTQYNVIYPSDAKPLDDDHSVTAWIYCFIPKSSVIMNMAVNSTIKEEGDVYKQDKNKEGEWTDGVKVGLNVAKYVKDFVGLTSAWMPGEVYTREYRKIPFLVAMAAKTADLA